MCVFERKGQQPQHVLEVGGKRREARVKHAPPTPALSRLHAGASPAGCMRCYLHLLLLSKLTRGSCATPHSHPRALAASLTPTAPTASYTNTAALLSTECPVCAVSCSSAFTQPLNYLLPFFASGLRTRKKNSGVNRPCLPPATRPSAARSSMLATSKLPLGAMPNRSRFFTRVCVTMRPALVVRKSACAQGVVAAAAGVEGAAVAGAAQQRCVDYQEVSNRRGRNERAQQIVRTHTSGCQGCHFKLGLCCWCPALTLQAPPVVWVHGVPPGNVCCCGQVTHVNHLKPCLLQRLNRLRGGPVVNTYIHTRRQRATRREQIGQMNMCVRRPAHKSCRSRATPSS